MSLLRLFPIKFLLTQLILLCLQPDLVLSQNQDSDIDDFLGAPDTIVFFSEEDVRYSEEYLKIHFYAVDESSRFPVQANFKIYNKEKNKLLSEAAEDKHAYQASLVSNEEYLIQVIAPGYKSFSEHISFNASEGTEDLHKIISLEKYQFYTTLRALNSLTGNVVNNAAITLINVTSNKTIHTLVNPETGDCKADFDLNSTYKVEVNAKGYHPYFENYVSNEKLDFKDFILTPIHTFTLVKIYTVDATTSKSVPARIKLLDSENIEIPVKLKKNFAEASIYSGVKYIIQAEAEGYDSLDEILIIDSEQEAATVKLIAKHNNIIERTDVVTDEIEGAPIFENLEIGKSVVLNNIFFDQSKYILNDASNDELNKLVTTLVKNPQYKIIIAGHTDNQGDKKLNQLLSQNRARVIANYLIEKGISEERLEVVGYGSSKPIAPNDSEENRMKNRRVEFTIK